MINSNFIKIQGPPTPQAAAHPDDIRFNLVVSLNHLFLCIMNPILSHSDSSEFVGLIFSMQTKTKSIVWIQEI